jgi:hypothetical protein
VYTKSDKYTFNVDAVRQPYDPTTVKTFASSPKAGFGKIPNLARGKVPEDWWYFPVIARLHSERSGYPTQKPEALLERIILASSNPGDLVADFFCGSGTAAVVATKLKRRFIANDVSFRAVHTTRLRLVGAASSAFSIQQISDSLHGSKDLALLQSMSLICDGRSVRLKTDQLETIDYWEIDPAWDEKLFHSACQAIRPRGKDSIRNSIILPDTDQKTTICARVVDIHGNWCRLKV